jgi:hypothetical protein
MPNALANKPLAAMTTGLLQGACAAALLAPTRYAVRMHHLLWRQRELVTAAGACCCVTTDALVQTSLHGTFYKGFDDWPCPKTIPCFHGGARCDRRNRPGLRFLVCRIQHIRDWWLDSFCCTRSIQLCSLAGESWAGSHASCFPLGVRGGCVGVVSRALDDVLWWRLFHCLFVHVVAVSLLGLGDIQRR